MRSRILASACSALGGVLLIGCSGAEPTLLPPGSVQPAVPSEFRIQNAEILQAESWPVQVFLEISGTISSSCHEVEVMVTGPDKDGVLNVEAVEELVEEDCTGSGEQFREAIPIGNFTEGHYVVLLNGERVGEFDLGGAESPAGLGGAGPLEPDDGGRDRGPVYIDETELTIMESFPVQVEIVIRGSLPTPCSTLSWTAEPADDQGRILVAAYSLQDSELACVQVLEAIEAVIPIGAYTEGSYSVWLNGELVGEFAP